MADSAAFAEEYAIDPIPPPKRAGTEEIFTTKPRWRCSIKGITAFVVRKALVTFNVKTSTHSSWVIYRNGFLIISEPALLTKMSIGLCMLSSRRVNCAIVVA
jgi:hypothetical protein